MRQRRGWAARRLERRAWAFLLALGACGSYDSHTAAPDAPPEPPPPDEPPSAEPTPEGLWTVSGSPPAAIMRLQPEQLEGSGDRAPATSFATTSAQLESLVAVAFDTDGNLWIASNEESRLLKFGAGELAAGGPRSAESVILPVSGSINQPTGLAFDGSGRLWVANQAGTLAAFEPGQLAAGGAQVAAVVIAGAGHPTALAFDALGTLWVSDIEASTISGYEAGQLEVSGSPAPAVRLSSVSGSLRNPSGLAFDSKGTLWVANVGGQDVVAFGPDQLVESGAPEPVRALRPPESPLSVPVAVAFDDEGNLWVLGGTGALTRFERAELGESGPPTPSGRLVIRGHAVFWSLAFWPRGFPEAAGSSGR